MAKGLAQLKPTGHQGHDPRAYFEFGEMLCNPDRPARVEAICAGLSLLPAVTVGDCERHATLDELAAVHTPELVSFLTRMQAEWDPVWPAEVVPSTFPCSFSHAKLPASLVAQSAYFCFDAGTPLGCSTVRAAESSAGCALQAAEIVASGTDL